MTEGSANKTVDYLGGFQYENENLSFFPTAEGYVNVLSRTINGSYFSYVYTYTDHLGNIRLRYTRDPLMPTTIRILEENHYYPYGLKHQGYNNEHEIFFGRIIYPPVVINPIPPNYIDGYQYKYNGKEYQDELGLNFYDYGARNYDAALGRWMNVDPLAEERLDISPYNYVQNNPLSRVDPDGTLDAPIYDPDGDFLGTDDEGLQGKAIVMDKENFTQSMSHEEALKNSKGAEGLTSAEAGTKLLKHYNGLKSRPDYDGKITLSEANEWFRNGNGEPLFADLSKIDLDFISSDKFKGIGDKQVFQTLFSSNDGLVYGNLTLKYEGGTSVTSIYDTYDFERHNDRSTSTSIGTRIKENMKRGVRNFATVGGRMVADRSPFNLYNKEFNIYFYGTGKISK